MNSINMIDLCNVFELDNLDETQYDYIFSTVPISKAMKRPVIQISSFLNFENQKIINTALNMSNSHFDFLQYFKKELFITQIDAANQQEVIKCMTHHVRKYEKIEDDFEMSVLKREEMAATNFGYMVAMPHPIKLNTHQTFICVGILKKPIYWQERNKVQVIFLSSFTKGFAKHNDQFFVTLSKLIESKPLIDQLIQKPSYETFTEIVKSINQEELYD